MASDAVVVASDIPAAREILGPMQVRGTEAEAGELLRAVLTEPPLREVLLAGQRERRAKFSARRMVSEWEGVYSMLTPSERRPEPLRVA
jgi:hypothetical protein